MKLVSLNNKIRNMFEQYGENERGSNYFKLSYCKPLQYMRKIKYNVIVNCSYFYLFLFF